MLEPDADFLIRLFLNKTIHFLAQNFIKNV